MTEFDILIEALSNGAPEEEITDLLTESKFGDEHRESQNFYLLMFEQYLDECSAYSFEGWDDMSVYGSPIIEKFWFELQLLTPIKFDYSGGIKRVLGLNNENKATSKKLSDGRTVLKIRILRSILDEIEDNNRKIARKEAEDQGYAPKEDEEDQQNDQDDGFGNDPF